MKLPARSRNHRTAHILCDVNYVIIVGIPGVYHVIKTCRLIESPLILARICCYIIIAEEYIEKKRTNWPAAVVIRDRISRILFRRLSDRRIARGSREA